MSQTLTLQLSDEVYEAIQRQARADGSSPAQIVTQVLEQQFKSGNGRRDGAGSRPEAEKETARQRFERHFGTVNLSHPTGADNDRIDADLAREYADTHEDQ